MGEALETTESRVLAAAGVHRAKEVERIQVELWTPASRDAAGASRDAAPREHETRDRSRGYASDPAMESESILFDRLARRLQATRSFTGLTPAGPLRSYRFGAVPCPRDVLWKVC